MAVRAQELKVINRIIQEIIVSVGNLQAKLCPFKSVRFRTQNMYTELLEMRLRFSAVDMHSRAYQLCCTRVFLLRTSFPSSVDTNGIFRAYEVLVCRD